MRRLPRSVGSDDKRRCAGSDSAASSTGEKGSKAKAVVQKGTAEGPAYDGECWAFSIRYIKTTQLALQKALQAIEVISCTSMAAAQHDRSCCPPPLLACATLTPNREAENNCKLLLFHAEGHSDFFFFF